MANSRLPHDASTLAEVTQYYATRALQLKHAGYRLTAKPVELKVRGLVAYRAEFLHANGDDYSSFYLPPESRGKGLFKELVRTCRCILTVADCNIVDALKKTSANYRCATSVIDTTAYKLIEAHYGDQRAKRSQVFLMNHIDEGLAVMAATGTSLEAMQAFCLHPLLQADADLARNYQSVASNMSTQKNGAYILGLAMEYRSIANEYLAHCKMPADGIRLSPLWEVNAMLVGDKVQNRKDYELYHEATHANRERLTEYFREWCERLGVDKVYPTLAANLKAS